MLLKDALIKVGFACAGGEVRRKCMQGAVKVNNVRVDDSTLTLIDGKHKLTVGRFSCYLEIKRGGLITTVQYLDPVKIGTVKL